MHVAKGYPSASIQSIPFLAAPQIYIGHITSSYKTPLHETVMFWYTFYFISSHLSSGTATYTDNLSFSIPNIYYHIGNHCVLLPLLAVIVWR